ncbi:armadillo-type protein [Mycena haematopus]|nr:armadillo-type protein [Mycena haematopus]
MEEEIIEEGRLFATFERHGEFADAQAKLLSLDLTEPTTPEQDRQEAALFRRLTDILDEYQEQAYLLDPFLEQLVEPVVLKIKHYAQSTTAPTNPARIERVALLLYSYAKSRGYKTISQLLPNPWLAVLPHEVADLELALACIRAPVAREPTQWALRYAALLWLSLICIIPFDLAQFDEGVEGETADALERLARPLLSCAGLERDAAALLLARLYMRKDTRVRFAPFLVWVEDECVAKAEPGSADAFTAIGALQVLSEVAKSGPADLIQAHAPRFFAIVEKVEMNEVLNGNTVVRKYKTKLVARIPLRMLPPSSNATRRKGRALAGGPTAPETVQEDDIDVPEEVEIVLEQLFKSLQDKDTIVRWSAAKAVARISERLPTEFADQVLDTLMALFAIHSIAAASLYDLPAIAESTWHGACLACAEMARRGLVVPAALPTLIEWLSKALYFDLRKGAHSIGSSVRDAAAYVLWALARAQDPASLAPHAPNLARRLVSVALFDREIHIRRAASAAVQEFVGRTGLFAHGIDVVRKTDFYAVSVRRNAFLVAAPQVAEHVEYRAFLFDHLLNVTARHWDVGMRRLGAQALRLICAPRTRIWEMGGEAKLLESADVADLHGALLALGEIAGAYRESTLPPEEQEQRLRESFACLALIPERILLGPRNELVTAARIDLKSQSAHRAAPVQEAAAEAMGAVSRLVDCALRSGGFAVQQNLGRVLGVIDYDAYPGCLNDATSGVRLGVEARRNCYAAIPQLLRTVAPRLPQHMTAQTFNALLDALLKGLEDYTLDERGDVGSWVRIACLRGLTAVCEIVIPSAGTVLAATFDQYFPAPKYHGIVQGVLKQGVERLDNVRQEAGEWTETEVVGWKDGAKLFPKAVRLLDISLYRQAILAGLVLSLGSKTESTHRPVGQSLVEYSKNLPLAGEEAPAKMGYNLVALARDLLAHARANFAKNAVVVPVLQTFNVLLEAGALRRLVEDPEGETSLQDLLGVVSRNVARLKSIQRIHESMKIDESVVNTLAFPTLFKRCVASLPDFLAHAFPSVRSDASEYLYLVLQGTDIGCETDEIEEVLLETEW